MLEMQVYFTYAHYDFCLPSFKLYVFSASDEVTAIKKSFVSDSLAFTSTLDQLDSMISRDGYEDAVEIIGSLEDDVDSAAIGNLQIWMASQSESTMTKLMSAVSEKYVVGGFKLQKQYK